MPRFILKEIFWRWWKDGLFLFFICFVSVLSLWQVHHNYTGKYSMLNDGLMQYHEVRNMEYAYPYFSDEWYAIGLAKEAISTHSLPLINPFDKSFFLNPEVFFHSFIAGIMAIFRLDPLLHYTDLSVFVNLIIIILVYVFLRICGVSRLSSSVSSLLILYITSASNLPGIWNLLPVTMGIIFCLAGFCFMALPYKHPVFVWVCGVLAVLFYPPLIIFYGLALAIFLENKKPFLIWGAVIILAFLALAIFSNSLFKFALGHIFFKSYTGSFFPRFNLLDVAPLPAIILAFFAVRKIFREKKWLFYQLGLGLFLWIFYTLTLQRIVIGHERALFFTSIIICIFSGFGQEEIKKYLPKLKYAQIAGLVFFLLFIPFYTQWETWRNLILTDPVAQADSIPMAPANNYLTQDDLRIFKNIENKKFFSAPWKGTVIGVATGNYPATTKGGTITMDSKNPGIYQKFMKAGCGEKINIAKERNVDYVYSMPFSCPEFIEKDRSSEGFVLYEYDR